jgi:hypothetical protein
MGSLPDIEKAQPAVFREGNALARNFTWPIIMSRKTVGGECTAIGAYTVVNDEGYFLTAFHIVKAMARYAC